jgi:hypothetical protein
VRPEKYTDHVGWNAHFELELALKYTRYRYTLPAMGSMKDGEWLWQEYTITDLNPMISQRTRRLMTDEGQLGALAVENLVYDNFESGWNQLPLERKELALEGHSLRSHPM